MNDSSLQETIEYSATNGYHFVPNSKNRKNPNTPMQDLIEYIVTSGKGFDERRLENSPLIKKLEIFLHKLTLQLEREQFLESNADSYDKITIINESLMFEKESASFMLDK